MRSSRSDHFHTLMFYRDSAINLHHNNQHYDAYMLEILLAREFYHFILANTTDIPQYQHYLYNTFQEVNNNLVYLHLQELQKAERELFYCHYNSLVSVASHVHWVKHCLPAARLLNQAGAGIFAARHEPQQQEDHPAPPPGFGPND